MDHICHYLSPFGGITLAACGDALTGLWFDGQKYYGETLRGPAEEKELKIFEDAFRWLDIYFSCRVPDFTPKLLLRGTPFRKAVWNILLEIPYGETVTYGSIAAGAAQRLGLQSMSAQAVGGAVGHNPISLIIPCHRVVGADGSLTGYAGGIDKKDRLLQLEKAAVMCPRGT